MTCFDCHSFLCFSLVKTLHASHRAASVLMFSQDVVGRIAHRCEFCRCTIKCAVVLFGTLLPLCVCVALRSAQTSSAQRGSVTQILPLRDTLTSIEGACCALVSWCCCFQRKVFHLLSNSSPIFSCSHSSLKLYYLEYVTKNSSK